MYKHEPVVERRSLVSSAVWTAGDPQLCGAGAAGSCRCEVHASPEGWWEPQFSQLGRLGLVSWQRHLAALATILVFWLVLGGLATVPVVLAMGEFDPATPLGYVAINAGFPFLIAGIAVAVRFIHKRPLRSLVTTGSRVDWRRVGQSFAVIFVLAAVTVLVEFLLVPQRYSLTFEPGRWLRMLPVILVLTTLQTSAEELLFRGYLLQASGLLTRRTRVLVAVNGLLFMLPHLANPEMTAGPLLAAYYFSFGAVMALVTLRDNRLERSRRARGEQLVRGADRELRDLLAADQGDLAGQCDRPRLHPGQLSRWFGAVRPAANATPGRAGGQHRAVDAGGRPNISNTS